MLEAVAMTFIAALGCSLVLQKGVGIDVVPLLGVLALGAQRLLPALQQMYSGWALVKGNHAAVHDVLTMLRQPLYFTDSLFPPFTIRDCIRFSNLSFQYPSDELPVIESLNIEIRAGECIGLIGGTGSGKSTFINLLMGLLIPSKGSIIVDGLDLGIPSNSNYLRAWQSSIAHVPQNIFLTDGTIAENIAFGVPYDDIDMKRVRNAAHQAQIADFIADSRDGYSTLVGERGVRLSGGQRQRIGIARALYKHSSVLVSMKRQAP